MDQITLFPITITSELVLLKARNKMGEHSVSISIRVETNISVEMKVYNSRPPRS